MASPQTTTPAGRAPVRAGRVHAVDVFRGLVLAFMVLTPATGARVGLPGWHHAPWTAVTVVDLVFPAFLVTSGVSLSFLLRSPSGAVRARLVRRFVALIAVGLAYNAYGDSGWDLSRLRYTGVLQLIASAGALATVIVLATRRAGRDRVGVVAAVAVAVVGVHGLGLELLGDRCAGVVRCSPWFDVDRQLFGIGHVYGRGRFSFDPEGIAVTIAATGLVLVGYLAGVVVHRHRGRLGAGALRLAVGGAALVALGGALDQVQAVSKRLFTPAFVSVAAGWALLGLAASIAVFDLGRRRNPLARGVAWQLTAFGRNALVVYLSERLLLQSARLVHVGGRTLEARFLDAIPVPEPWVHVAYTALVLLAIGAAVSELHRRRRYVTL